MMSEYCPIDIATLPVSDNQNGKANRKSLATPTLSLDEALKTQLDHQSFIIRLQNQGNGSCSPPVQKPFRRKTLNREHTNLCLLISFFFSICSWCSSTLILATLSKGLLCLRR